MTKEFLPPEDIALFLVQKLRDKDAYFVFPTDTALNSWAENIILNPSSGITAVPLERFIPWDSFKRTWLRSTKDGYEAVPSVLRKFFIQEFIARNAEKPQAERLQVIINSSDEFASTAYSFSDWLCSNLPSLHYWKKKLDEAGTAYGELDDEDRDYLTLYEEYSSFLESHALFEPAWTEKYAFDDTGRHFYIFYPELLEDFRDFEKLLESAPDITLCLLKDNLPSPQVYFYPDSRTELRQTILRILDLYRTGKADFSEMALSVPDIELYRPYLEREFELYNVPFVIKSGRPLTENSAGKIFSEINDVHTSAFSFDSVRTLLLDETVPWKDELEELKLSLIREGNRMRCILSYDGSDIWEKAFDSKIKRLSLALEHAESEERKDALNEQIDFYRELKDFYKKLKITVNEFFKDRSFSNILRAWNIFKEGFLKEDKDFDEEANLILGRCICELQNIIQIEKKYSADSLRINSPFEFFIQELSGTKYQKQTEEDGVRVFSYRVAAAAAFKYQFVIDSSQKNLEVPYKRLTFLNSQKRRKLHLTEEDKTIRATEAYIALYAKMMQGRDENFVVFSAAQQTFSGFAIPHNQLIPVSEEELDSLTRRLNASDFILAEKNYYLHGRPFPESVTASQKQQFNAWKESCLTRVDDKVQPGIEMVSKIRTSLYFKRSAEDGLINTIHISARGDLEKFFPCPRRWVLSSVLHLHEDSLDTKLMQPYDTGNLHHKILELFAESYLKKTLPEYDAAAKKFMLGGQEIEPDILSLTEQAIKEPSDFRDCPLVTKTLELQKDKIAATITDFLKVLLLPYGSGKSETSGIGGCTVTGTETTLSHKDEDGNFCWYGKIDLLVMTPDDNFMIIDYKNSNSSFPAKKELLPDSNGIMTDFQMPLYTKLILSKFSEAPYAAVYYSIRDCEKCEAFNDSEGKISFDDYKPALIELNDYAGLFKKKTEILEFEPCSGNDERDKLGVKYYETCTSCAFRTICRTTYSIARRQIKKNTEN